MSGPKEPYLPGFGTDPSILHRRDSIDTSIDAAYQVNTSRLERIVFETIRNFGARGCISDDVRQRHPMLPYSSVTARFRALLDKGYIVDTGERRRGRSGKSQRVMAVVPTGENAK